MSTPSNRNPGAPSAGERSQGGPTKGRAARKRPLLWAAGPILMFLREAAAGPKEMDSASVRDHALELLHSMERKAGEAGVGASDIENAKYSIVVTMDDLILNGTGWPGKAQWMLSPWQRDLFGSIVGGKVFFDRLEKIRRDPSSNRDLLEIYLVCMLIGFRGQERMSPPAVLDELMKDVAAELARRSKDDVESLSAHPTSEDVDLGRRIARIPIWSMLLVFVSGAILIGVLFSYKASQVGDRVSQAIGDYLLR
jgi:type VI secretion system protein ImpK